MNMTTLKQKQNGSEQHQNQHKCYTCLPYDKTKIHKPMQGIMVHNISTIGIGDGGNVPPKIGKSIFRTITM